MQRLATLIITCALVAFAPGHSSAAGAPRTAAELDAKAAADYRQAVDRTNQQCRAQRLAPAQCAAKLKSLESQKQKLDQQAAAMRKAEQDLEQARTAYARAAQASLARLQPRGAPPLVPKTGEDTGQLRGRFVEQLESLKRSCGKGRDPTKPPCTQIEPERQRDQAAYQQFLQRQAQEQAQIDAWLKRALDTLRDIQRTAG